MNQKSNIVSYWLSKLTSNMDSSLNICKLILNENINDVTEIKNSIKNIPKCMYVLSRPICKCKKKCLTRIRNKIEPKLDKCSLYDVKETFSDNYENCDYLKKSLLSIDILDLLKLDRYDVFDEIYIHKDNYKNIINLFCAKKIRKHDFECYVFAFRDVCIKNNDCKKFKEHLQQTECKLRRFNLANYIIKNILDTYNETEKKLSKRSILIPKYQDNNNIVNLLSKSTVKPINNNVLVTNENNNLNDYLKNDTLKISDDLSRHNVKKIKLSKSKKLKPSIVLETDFFDVIVDEKEEASDDSKPSLILIPKKTKSKIFKNILEYKQFDTKFNVNNNDLMNLKYLEMDPIKNDLINSKTIFYNKSDYSTNLKLIFSACGGFTISIVILYILYKHLNINKNYIFFIAFLIILLNIYTCFLLVL